MKYPKVSIIVLNTNDLKDTLECLPSLKKMTYRNYDVIVVDNASTGDDVKILREEFGDYVHIIENDKNYGYTGGNNVGMKYCLDHSQPDYFLILNPDTVVDPDLLSRVTEFAEKDTSIGIVDPKVYYYQSPNCIQSAGGKINMWTGQTSSIGIKQADVGQYDKPREVDYIAGCCMLIKKGVISKIGLFDESYFCYWDETDYCTRARKAGYKVIYVPEASIRHKAPMKEKVWQKTLASRRASCFTQYYSARNSFKFMRKHATKLQYVSFLACFFGYQFLFMTALCLLYYRDPNRLTSFYRGVMEGLLHR